MPGFRVDFLIGGTQKGGTTALAHFLSQHPEICLPTQKEAHFFDAADFPADQTPEAGGERYRKLFPAGWQGRRCGDATPVYMFLPEVARRVWRYNPAMKWIVLLRDPVERAVSHYRMERGRGNEPLPFDEAIAAERGRLRKDRDNRAWNSSMRLHGYAARGLYTRQIRRVRRLFGADAVLVLTTAELRHGHEETLRRVYDFLGVRDRGFVPPAELIFATQGGEAVSEEARAKLRRKFRWEMWKLRWLLGRERFRSLRGDEVSEL